MGSTSISLKYDHQVIRARGVRVHSGSEGSSEANCYTARTVLCHAVAQRRVQYRASGYIVSCDAESSRSMPWSGVNNTLRQAYVMVGLLCALHMLALSDEGRRKILASVQSCCGKCAGAAGRDSGGNGIAVTVVHVAVVISRGR
jgi:hypothetical protein